MSVPERRAMVERPSENLSVRRQCVLLNLARSGVYRSGACHQRRRSGQLEISRARVSARFPLGGWFGRLRL